MSSTEKNYAAVVRAGAERILQLRREVEDRIEFGVEDLDEDAQGFLDGLIESERIIRNLAEEWEQEGGENA